MKIKYSLPLVMLGMASSLPTAVVADDSSIEEVVVTGSRIIDPNVISSSQIAVVDGQDIIDAGVTRVEDFLNDMPQH